MTKALVIKGANFATNKVDTVTLTDPIPCTSVSISDSTHSFTAIGATKQLTAAALPANTTDELIWYSSNPNVATVSATGLVTCTGVGSCTISAMCGSKSADCAITSTVTINASTSLTKIDGYGCGSSYSQGKDYIGAGSYNARYRLYLDPTPTTAGYKAISTSDSSFNSLYPIMIPQGTTSITINAPSGFDRKGGFVLADSTQQPTYNISGKGCRSVADVVEVNFANNKSTFDISSYTGYDSCVVCLSVQNGDASQVTGDVTITFA